MRLINVVGSVFTGRVVAASTSMATAVLVSQFMGPIGKGEFAFLTMSAGLLAQVLGLLAGPAVVYLLPRGSRPSMALAGFLSIGALAVLGFAVSWVASSAGVRPAWWSVDLGLLGIVVTTSSYAVLLVYASGRVVSSAWLTAAQPALLLLLLLAAYGNGRQELDLLVPALALSHALPGIVAMAILAGSRALQGSLGWRSVASAGGSLAAFGLIVQIANLMQFLSYRVDFFFVRHYLGVSSLGVYSVAVNVAEAIWLVPTAVATVLFSMVANAQSSIRMHEHVVQSARASFVVAAVLVIIACSLPTSLWSILFGAGFDRVRFALVALSPGVTVFAPGSVVASYFAGTGRFRVNAGASAVGLVVGLVGYALLVPRLGIVGAGLASSVAYIATACVLLRAFAKETGIPVRPLDLRRLLASIIWVAAQGVSAGHKTEGISPASPKVRAW
ncbi:MAG: polysaccharide biosynthesis C-terminal domain-containing protein [Nitrospirae bacterium]|nr:polysaccharide biosynthesis C-terminal domain-containing protein [Nitrospirota bacterium]